MKVKVPDIHRRGYLIKQEFKNTCDEIKSLKKDILKMIDAIEKNEMHIKQLNWKIKDLNPKI
jgi:septal ring factor EnvC (AmiA/AmiB activator)